MPAAPELRDRMRERTDTVPGAKVNDQNNRVETGLEPASFRTYEYTGPKATLNSFAPQAPSNKGQHF